MFLDRVDPLSKVIHVPSVQPLLVQAASDMESISPQQQVRLLSMFTAAIISLSKDECIERLELSWPTALQQFFMRTKLAMKTLNIIKYHKMDVERRHRAGRANDETPSRRGATRPWPVRSRDTTASLVASGCQRVQTRRAVRPAARAPQRLGHRDTAKRQRR